MRAGFLSDWLPSMTKTLSILVPALAFLLSSSGFSQHVPQLKGPFTIEFEELHADTRTQDQFERDEAVYKGHLESDVKVGKLTEAAVQSILAQRVDVYNAFKAGVKEYLTLSSDGKNLLVINKQDPSPDVPIGRLGLIRDGRFYSLTPGSGAVPAGLLVTKVDMFPIGQELPLLGCQLPAMPTVVKVKGSNLEHKGQVDEPVEFEIQAADSKSQARYVPGIWSWSPNPKFGEVLTSAILGKKDSPSLGWKLTDYAQRGDVHLPSTIQETVYDPSGGGHATKVLTFKLVSFKPEAMPKESFIPEHYLPGQNGIQYDILKKSGRPLYFQYKANGTTIEEQAEKQDTLELGLVQRDRREPVPSASNAGIFGIVAIAIAVAAVITVSRRRRERQ